MKIWELDTPAMVVDLDIFERNLNRVADYAKTHKLRLRPHTKTHKSPEVAARQLDLGAAGLTVAKVSEGEVLMEKLSPVDLLIAFPIFGEAKLTRLRQLAAKTRVTVALDSLAAARQLQNTGVDILIEIDVGLGRVGVTPPEAMDLAREVRKIPGVHFRGISFYPGHIKSHNPEAIRLLSAGLCKIVQGFEHAQMPLEIVSGGSTPALFHSHEIEGLNEIRPGTYVYNDLNTIVSGACTLEDCAASILVTVVSTPRANTAIVDGGSKTFSSDRYSGPMAVSFGLVTEAPETHFHKMNEEHGFLDTADSQRDFVAGEKLRIVPNHICVAMNLHETVYGIRGEEVERSWKVAGRGKLQ